MMHTTQTATNAIARLHDLSVPSFRTEANDIYVPSALDPDSVSTIMELCSGPLHSEFRRNTNQYADLDEIRLISRGQELFGPDHFLEPISRRIIDIALSDGPDRALRAAAQLDRPPLPSELVIFRMGPGTYNGTHTHGKEFTANILLQDNPRAEGSLDGLLFTGYVATDGPLENPIAPDELLRPPYIYRHFVDGEVGGMHARKKDVYHGVARISGDRELSPAPESCRYVLTYVLAELRANPDVTVKLPKLP